MRVRDELLRAAVYADADPATIVRVWMLAPLVEHAVRLQQAADAEAVLEAMVDERVKWLEKTLTATRRELALAHGRLAALEVLA